MSEACITKRLYCIENHLKKWILFNQSLTFSMAYLQKFLSDDRVWRYSHGFHQICIIPLDIFNGLPIKRWKHNRPPDKERVQEIHNYMIESKRVDGMIYLACVDKELVCYESNHRREALEGLTDVQSILVDILWDATDEMVKTEFLRLNKAVSVPELYITDEPVADMDSILSARKVFCERSTSRSRSQLVVRRDRTSIVTIYWMISLPSLRSRRSLQKRC